MSFAFRRRLHAMHPDLAVVDALARLKLAARRLGYSIRVRDPSVELAELLELVGLGLDLEVIGETERREEVGVEEAVERGDVAARHLDHLNRPRRMAARGVDAVLTERRAAVGGRRKESRPAALDTGTEHPPTDLGGPA